MANVFIHGMIQDGKNGSENQPGSVVTLSISGFIAREHANVKQNTHVNSNALGKKTTLKTFQ